MAALRQFITPSEAQPPYFVGVDLGGTNIKAGVVDDRGKNLSWHSVPTLVDQGPEEGSRRLAAAILEAVRLAGLTPADIAGVGLGTPGTMDIPNGILLTPSNLPGWWHFPIRDRVAQHSGLPVSYLNDANAAAYGEFWLGSGRRFNSMVLFTLGTGVGGGIIIGDLSVDGENSAGGELGHMIIDYNETARLCSCGHTGHLEAYAGATAVVRRTAEALAAGRSSISARLDAGEELTPVLVATEAAAGDGLALEIVLATARYLAIGVVNVMHSVDPSAVVIGGAMTFGGHASELGRRFLLELQIEVRRRALPMLAERTTIDFAALGGDAGYIGAAGIARLTYYKK